MPRSQHDRYVPKHRQPPARRASRAAVRTMFVLSGAAVVGTGAAVAGGSLTLVPTGPADAAATLTDAALGEASSAGSSASADSSRSAASTGSVQASGAEVVEAASSADPSTSAAPEVAQETARREAPLSRSDRRGTADPRKQAALAAGGGSGNAITRSEDASDDDPRAVAEALVGDATQFGCLDSLWTKESGWRVDADNPSSSAYGIPQALPGSKMSSAGADWATNPVTQIRWGLGYIEDRYGSPCGAWSHSVANNWY